MGKLNPRVGKSLETAAKDSKTIKDVFFSKKGLGIATAVVATMGAAHYLMKHHHSQAQGTIQVTPKNISYPAQNIPYGLKNTPTARIQMNGSGYLNPRNQLGKYNMQQTSDPDFLTYGGRPSSRNMSNGNNVIDNRGFDDVNNDSSLSGMI